MKIFALLMVWGLVLMPDLMSAELVLANAWESDRNWSEPIVPSAMPQEQSLGEVEISLTPKEGKSLLGNPNFPGKTTVSGTMYLSSGSGGTLTVTSGTVKFGSAVVAGSVGSNPAPLQKGKLWRGKMFTVGNWGRLTHIGNDVIYEGNLIMEGREGLGFTMEVNCGKITRSAEGYNFKLEDVERILFNNVIITPLEPGVVMEVSREKSLKVQGRVKIYPSGDAGELHWQQVKAPRKLDVELRSPAVSLVPGYGEDDNGEALKVSGGVVSLPGVEKSPGLRGTDGMWTIDGYESFEDADGKVIYYGKLKLEGDNRAVGIRVQGVCDMITRDKRSGLLKLEKIERFELKGSYMLVPRGPGVTLEVAESGAITTKGEVRLTTEGK